ncbi:MAG: ABC transporter permease [Candidatus Lambdaproteobacteria bacterium]|nr:ABC transporter permease [Candidatus Lambdaproteobacteria bacterium]
MTETGALGEQIHSQSLWHTLGIEQAWEFCKRKPLGAIGAFIMIVMVVLALLADFVTAIDPVTTNADKTLQAPNSVYWMGTDYLGRDIYSRIIFGTRISLTVGILATLFGGLSGLAIGLVSGYMLGWMDLVVQRFMDVFQALPRLVLALVMSAALGPSIQNVVIAIAVPLIPIIARVVRSSTLAVRELPFVEAARAAGMAEWRIALIHVLPNTLAPFIVLVTAQLGAAILVEASLSFLGLGVPEPHPSWGRMLSESAAEYAQQAPWLVIFPGLAISAAVFGTNLLGDALRDELDPRLKQ